MFKKSASGLVALTYLSGDVLAIKSKFRPPEGTVPWHKEISTPTWEKPDWDVNYFVPNFGSDQDMIDTKRDIKVSEKMYGKQFTASWDDTKEKDNYAANPRNYFVPDFGQDEDIKNVQSVIQKSENALGKTFTADFDATKAKVNPRNYFVPDFGVDQDIINTTTSINNSEKRLNKKFSADFGADEAKVNPRNYFVPHFGIDQDIQNVSNSIAVSEKALGHKWTPTQDKNGYWNTPQAADNASYGYNKNVYVNNSGLLQLESDPICSSSGCDQYKHPKKEDDYPRDYDVPNFGQDHDIRDSFNSEAIATKTVGHKWNWKEVEKPDIIEYSTRPLEVDIEDSLSNLRNQEGAYGSWRLPPSLVQLETESDPICSSAGCTQYKHPENEEDFKKDYPVPNFGQDHDIAASLNNEQIASKIVGHKWEWKKIEDPKDQYTVPSFGVDEDIKNVQAAIASEENLQGHVWTPKQDKNGYWSVPEAADNSSYGYNMNQYINNNGLVQLNSDI